MITTRGRLVARRLLDDRQQHPYIEDVGRGVEQEQRHQARQSLRGDQAAESPAETEAGVRADAGDGCGAMA
jgi:hypothetical protein